MEKIIEIDVIENDKCRNHEDLLFEIPKLDIIGIFDTYYFAIKIEPKYGLQEVKNAVARLIFCWIKKTLELKDGDIIYLPIEFSDQYTSCLKLEKSKDLNVSFGYSMTEGHSINPLNPDDGYFHGIDDFKKEGGVLEKVNQDDFIGCLVGIIQKLENK